jgi:hypothetical protein
MEKIESQKGKHLLLNDGFRYRKARVNSNGSTSWRCVEANCKGRLKVHDNDSTIITEHSHPADLAQNEAAKSVAEMRRRAAEGLEKPRQIIQHCTGGISLEAARQLPTYTASQRTIERKRKRTQQPYLNPTTVAEIIIPDALRNTLRNAAFVLWDSGEDDVNRILMFGTEENLDILEQHRHWFMDGTFKVAPEMFFQVFSIHALVDKSAAPLIYVLLQDKSETSYARVFQKVLQLKPTLNPLSMMADFEKASHNAVRQVFPAVQLVGCLFHLGQCLWRKVQDLHLADRYRDDENFRSHVKMILALSFVPSADVANAFEMLVESCPREVDPILDYWEDNYIGRNRRNRRAAPLFAIQLWNVRDRVTDGLPRTNNSVEAWHRSFQQTIDCHHPSVFKLIGQFRKEQDKVEIDIARFQAGNRQAEASKAKYVQLSRRLCTLVPTYDNAECLDYLRRIAYNLAI